MTDQSTVYQDTYDTFEGAERFADQIAGDNPGTFAVVTEAFYPGETDEEAAREKGRLSVVWSSSREQIDAWLAQATERGPFEFVVQYEAGSA
jgi:hypothetical protein